MPLIAIRQAARGVNIGQWLMTERPEPKEYRSLSRQREYTCVRLLLAQMYPDADATVSYEASGRPLLSTGDNISISHSQNYCCIITSPVYNVAIDIEEISSRVDRISSRLLRSDEQAPTLRHRIIHWCAKETLYKFYSKECLGLQDIRIEPFDLDQDCGQGVITAENIKRSCKLDVHYCIDADKIITYCYA